MKKLIASLIILSYMVSAYAAVTVSVNGSNHTIPETGEKGWGTNVTAWIQAISANTLQPSGGTFTLTNDVDFGATAGLKAGYYQSRASDLPSSGILRLGNDESIVWRNAADDNSFVLKVNSSDQLELDGSVLPLETLGVFDDSGFQIEDNSDATKELEFSLGGATTSTKITVTASQTANRTITLPDATDTLVGKATTDTLTNKSIDGDDNTLSDIGITSLKTVLGDANEVVTRDGSGVIQSSALVDANVSASADIARTKLADGTANHVIINDGDGVLSSEAALAISRGGTGQATKTAGMDALSPTTTKGDILVDDGTNVIRLAVGANDTVLKANSAVTAGVEWASATSTIAVRSVTETDTATSADDIIVLSSASFTQTLPDATANEGKVLELLHNGTSLTQVYTLATAGETIGGVASGSYALYTSGEKLKIVSDGTNWLILDHKTDTGWVNAGAITIGAVTTPPTKGTTAVDKVLWRRDGSDAILKYYYRQTTASAGAGSGDYLIGLPSLGNVDTSLISTYSGSFAANDALPQDAYIGEMSGGVSSSNLSIGKCFLYSATQFRVSVHLQNSTSNAVMGSGFYQLTTANQGMAFEIRVPIEGWQP